MVNHMYPLSIVTPTLDAAALQVLLATHGSCTAAEVHRRMGYGSDEGVRKVLGRLVRQGIVTVETPARYPLYTLNRRHVAFEPIEQLSRARQTVVDRIVAAIDDWSIKSPHVSAFGSFARGMAGVDSDIDILAMRPRELAESEEAEWSQQLANLTMDLQAWTGNAVQILDPTPETVRQMQRDEDPLFQAWRADEVRVYGDYLLEALRGVQ